MTSQVLAVFVVGLVATGCSANRELTWADPTSGAGKSASGLPLEVIDRGTGIRLVLVPAGLYWRGSVEESAPPEDVYQDIGFPAHPVRISRPFYIGKYEITQKQWSSVMDSRPSEHKGPDLPVEGVTWDETVEFCRRTGFRLPTEAEWEFACRGGVDNRCEHFRTPVLEYAWCYENSGGKTRPRHTHPVGLKRANRLGAHDMLGNVCEWVQGWWRRYDRDEETLVDPIGPTNGEFRLSRGGSYEHSGRDCHCTNRIEQWPNKGGRNLGFRVTRDVGATMGSVP